MYDGEWRPVKRGGLPVLRPADSPPPCWKCPKIPDGAEPKPANAVELSERNAAAYWFYLSVKGGCPCPDDAVVRRNHALIRRVEDSIESIRQDQQVQLAMLAGRTQIRGAVRNA